MLNGQNQDKTIQRLLAVINKLIFMIVVLVAGIIAMPFVLQYAHDAEKTKTEKSTVAIKDTTTYWVAPDINTITDSNLKLQVAYGKELIAHTSKYLGPLGSVSKISNGMNCQNCHLQAGTVTWGNNYGSVASLYPKFRARSGSIENIYKRVNDCIERSLNGKALDTVGKEMQAITAYINFLGSNVVKGKKAAGSGFKDLAKAVISKMAKVFLTRKKQNISILPCGVKIVLMMAPVYTASAILQNMQSIICRREQHIKALN